MNTLVKAPPFALNKLNVAVNTVNVSTLSEEQQVAVSGILANLAVKGTTTLLVGYAGTGKTYAVASIVSELDTDSIYTATRKKRNPVHTDGDGDVGVDARVSSTGEFDTNDDDDDYIKYANVCITAPTFKALGVLKSKLRDEGINIHAEGIEFRTLHSILGMTVIKDEDGEKDCLKGDTEEPNFPNYRYVICDEASMLGDDLLTLIDIYRSKKQSLLFVGDDMQLPPIKKIKTKLGGRVIDYAAPDCTSVFAKRVQPTTYYVPNRSNVFNVPTKYTLSTIMRQNSASAIVSISMMLRNKQSIGKAASLNDIRYLIPQSGSNVIISDGVCETGANALVEFMRKERHTFNAIYRGVNSRSLLEAINTHIVAYTNKTVFKYNRRIHDALFPDTPFHNGEVLVCYDTQDYTLLNAVADENGEIKPHRFYNQNSYVVSSSRCLSTPDPDFPELALSEVTMTNEYGNTLVVILPNDPELYFDLAKQRWDDIKNRNTEFYNFMQDATKTEREAFKKETERYKEFVESFEKRYLSFRFDYVLTVHKSQGSTHKTTILMFNELRQYCLVTGHQPHAEKVSLFNSALYVALTRPKNKAIIYTGS